MKFEMEIKEIKQRKTVSNDHEFSIKMVCADSKLLSLGVIPPNKLVTVDFEVEE